MTRVKLHRGRAPMSRRSFVSGATALAGVPLLSAIESRRAAAAFPARQDSGNGETYSISAIDLVYGTPPPTDGPGLTMINERFNVEYEPQFVPEATYTEKLTAVIASGDIPDIISFRANDSNFYKWAGQGAFLALDDLVRQSDKYPTFEPVPQSTWNGCTVDGKIYGIPQYYPPYSLTPSIRQDWLDRLGLAMPTTYDELKQVALTFTTEDPAGTGQDTYGVAMGQNINPHYAMGAYWDPGAWYHRNDEGQLIPGWITEATKQRIQFLADLYQEGAVTRDFAVLNWADTNNEFYSGRAGIFIGAPRGMSQEYMQGLLQIQPEARPVPIPPFNAPDDSWGFLATAGFSGITALSAELADDPGRVERILEMIDFGRQFYPLEQQNPQNAEYDWYMGGDGQGYEMVEGKAVSKDNPLETKGLAPMQYFVDSIAWPPTPEAIDYSAGYTKVPIMAEWAGALQQMWAETEPYTSPQNGIISATDQEKGGDLLLFIIGEQTKMVAGQRSIDTWDDMVAEYLAMGADQVIAEINTGIEERDQAQ